MDENKDRGHGGCGFSKEAAGFTIVELLLVIVLSSIVLTGIYSVFRAQQKAHATNTQVVQMQQNLRMSLAVMERDIRMAGYSPTGNVDVGFVQAREGLFRVTMDLNDDGQITGADEDISYGLADNDADLDGRLDSDPVDDLGRDTGGGMQPMARNIEAVYFAYAFDDNRDGELDTDAGGNVIWAVDSTDDAVNELDLDVLNNSALAGGNVSLDRIQAVNIWLLARSETALRDYADNKSYTVGRYTVSGNGAPFMHRLVETAVKCRNMNF